MSTIGTTRVQVFAAPLTTPDGEGLSAGAINAEIDNALAALAEQEPELANLKDLTATVTPTGLHFEVRAVANTRGSFDLELSPGTGPAAAVLDDDQILRAEITDVVTEKGNVFGQLCRTRARLEAAISGQAGALTRTFSAAAIERVTAALQAAGGVWRCRCWTSVSASPHPRSASRPSIGSYRCRTAT